jgi:acyl-CoA synthetase (NDP forming)
MDLNLDPLFNPKTIAVIGASRDKKKVGSIILKSLMHFHGKLYPVNPNAKFIFGHKCYPTVEAIGKPIDLGIIATRADIVPGLIRNAKNMKTAIIISSGFSEVGNFKLKDELIAAAKETGTRILGPNCIGIQVPSKELNATFMKPARSGEYALISQSGAVCSSIIDWSVDHKLGFSKIISIGNAYDLSFAELIDYLQGDNSTKKILLYIEGLNNGKKFMDAAKKSKKPIYALKVGKTAEGVQAAKTHTGALAGSYGIYKDVFRQVGVTEIKTLKDLFLFLKMSKMSRKEVIVLSNAGGPATATADLLSEGKIPLKKLSKETMNQLSSFLPQNWSRSNPVDILGDATPDRYEKSMAILSKENANILVLLTPQEMTDPQETARRLSKFKNIVCVFIGGKETTKARLFLEDIHIPAFEFPEQAVDCLGLLR